MPISISESYSIAAADNGNDNKTSTSFNLFVKNKSKGLEYLKTKKCVINN